MQYRSMDKLGFSPSIFGVGLMRLPTDGTRSGIKFELTTPLIHKAIDMGVTYFDTAYVYHDGVSEVALCKALKARPGDREKIKIATKLPLREGGCPEVWEKMLDESLSRMGIDCVDFYLLHGLDGKKFDMVKDEALPFLDKMVQKGKIRYPSFSFHDDVNAFRRILDSYNWCMAQVQFNLLDTFNQASLEGIRYAGKKGVPVVVMEPLRGGALARHIPAQVQKLYDEFPIKRSPVEWAFRYVYNQSEVKVILSGIGTPEELEQNVDIFSRSAPGSMTAEELALIEQVRKAYESLAPIGCTGCRYCEPGCPMNIAIPDIFRSYDNAHILGTTDRYAASYERFVKDDRNAGKCIGCGQCEGVCPQHLPIISHLANLSEKYEK